MDNIQKIIPNLWFDHNAQGAIDFYMSVFTDCKIIRTEYYPKTKEEGLADFQIEFAGKILTIEFEILGTRFVAINAGPEFKFNESISFTIPCKDQAEIDYYWDRLTSDGGQESVCGWCKDKYGLSRQITPINMGELMKKSDAFIKLMNMKKIVIEDL